MKVSRRPGPAARTVGSMVRDLNRVTTRIGFFESAKYPNGTPVAYVATIQEYGYAKGGIPPRSFMRTSVTEYERPWTELMAKGMRQAAKGSITVTTVMQGMGIRAQGDVQKKIASIWDPALKDATVKARLRRYKSPVKGKGIPKSLKKPLNDTGFMIASLSWNLSIKGK